MKWMMSSIVCMTPPLANRHAINSDTHGDTAVARRTLSRQLSRCGSFSCGSRPRSSRTWCSLNRTARRLPEAQTTRYACKIPDCSSFSASSTKISAAVDCRACQRAFHPSFRVRASPARNDGALKSHLHALELLPAGAPSGYMSKAKALLASSVRNEKCASPSPSS